MRNGRSSHYMLRTHAFLAPAETLVLKTSKENAHSAPITSVDFSPDGKTIVSGSLDKTLKVWDSGA